MKLDFTALSAVPVPLDWNARGQVGTVGTPVFMRVPAHRGGGDKAETGGDDGQEAPAHAAFDDRVDRHQGPSCPRVSPPCPQAQPARKLNEINVSPLSPLAPGLLANSVSAEETDREAFEERAAIMEFDGGMNRVEAEAAALALLSSRRSINRRNRT